ncbi:hypothetical protein RUW52_18540, partial [Klebsiella pneumoniae]|nr:hypothetical protein [Klebsiella pneumoniae]
SCYPGASHCQLNNTSPSIRFSLYAYLSTVGQAFDLDYRLIVVNDYCADPDPDTNMFLLKKVLPQHAFVTSSSEISKPGHKTMNF